MMQRFIVFLLAVLLLTVVVLSSNWLGVRLSSSNGGIQTLGQNAGRPEGTVAQQGGAPAPVRHIVANPAAQDPVRSVSRDETLYIAVAYTQTVEAAGLADGTRRIIVTAVLGNHSTRSVIVAQTALALLAQDGKRYTPNAPDGRMAPMLIATEIAPDSTLYGFVSFDIASDLTGALLEWCLDGAACQDVIQARLP